MKRNDRAKEDTFVVDHLFMRASVNSSVATINPKRIYPRKSPKGPRDRASITFRETLRFEKARGKCATFSPSEGGERESPGNHEGRLFWAFPTRISSISSRNWRHPLSRTTAVKVDVLPSPSARILARVYTDG